MADDTDEIVVHIEDDTGTTDNVVVEKDKPAADPAVQELKTQYAELQRTAEAGRVAREAAERRANDATRAAEQARNDATAARSEIADSQRDTVSAGLSAAQTESQAAQDELAAAMEAGDYKRAAKANQRIASAEARIVRLDEAHADLEARKTAQPKQQDQRTESRPQERRTDDPVEAYISGRSEPTAKWLRAHPDWVTDQTKNVKLTRAHHSAMAEGIDLDSNEYFEHIETAIGLRQTQTNGSGNGAKPVRRASAPVAPVNNTGGGTNGGGTTVTLTRGEALAATDGTHVFNYDDPNGKFKKGQPIGTAEFARRKLEMKKQGLYDRNNYEA